MKRIAVFFLLGLMFGSGEATTHTQDLTTQLAKFLVDLRAGTLGINQPLTSGKFSSGVTVGSAVLLTTTTALTNTAAAQTATLTNGPAAGNPTKWITINDNGTTRSIPSW